MTQARDLADGKFDTNTLVVDAANNRVGIGTTSPDRSLHITNSEPSIVLENSGQGTDLKTWRMYSNSSSLQIGTVDDAFSTGQNALEITRDNTDNITGIQFKTGASSEIGRFTTDGLTFNGDTAAANALDDYEEGTWTPSSTGTATYNQQYGRYRKVGDVVYIMLLLQINSIGTGEQNRISGLPFAAARECTIHASKFENINLSIVDGTLRTSGTFLYLTHRTAAAASSTSNSGYLKDSAVVQASGWYHTSD